MTLPDFYHEVTFHVARAGAPVLEEALRRLFPQGWREEDGGGVVSYSVYVAPGDYPARVDELEREAAPFPLAHLRVTTIRNEDWAHNWKQYYHPFRVGERIVIRPSWERYDALDGDIVIEMDPGMAFGTGQHASTQLCLRLMERWLRPGDDILDLGTGSGVLALCALRLGASRAWAIDIDPVALEYARENVRRNRLSSRTVIRTGAGFHGLRRRFSLIAANIVASALVELAPRIVRHLEPGGVFIGGGIIVERADEVSAAFLEHGLHVVEEAREGEWAALAARTGQCSM